MRIGSKPRTRDSGPASRLLPLDPFRGYANAIRDELPDVIQILDAFHVVNLASTVGDDVRRRVQQDTLGHRGRKGDPLFQIRRSLQIGAEHLSEKRIARLNTKPHSPDSATNKSVRSTTHHQSEDENSWQKLWPHSRRARSLKSPGSDGP